jgi:hypothetical protein
MVPPINLVSKCINHLVSCKAVGTLVVPKCPSAVCWPLLFNQNLKYVAYMYVRDVLKFFEVDRIFVSGNTSSVNSIYEKVNFNGYLKV